jgi:hypothetical protein
MVGLSLGLMDQQVLMRSLTAVGQLLSTTGRSPPRKTALSNSSDDLICENGRAKAQTSHSRIPKE